jgi:hypothetical protein
MACGQCWTGETFQTYLECIALIISVSNVEPAGISELPQEWQEWLEISEHSSARNMGPLAGFHDAWLQLIVSFVEHAIVEGATSAIGRCASFCMRMSPQLHVLQPVRHVSPSTAVVV